MLSSRLAPRGRRAPEPEGHPGGRQVQRGEQRQAALVLVQLVEDLTHVDDGEHHHHDRDHGEQQPPTGTQPDRDRQRERQRGGERDERRRFEVDTEQRRVLAALLRCLPGARLAVRLLAGRLVACCSALSAPSPDRASPPSPASPDPVAVAAGSAWLSADDFSTLTPTTKPTVERTSSATSSARAFISTPCPRRRASA